MDMESALSELNILSSPPGTLPPSAYSSNDSSNKIPDRKPRERSFSESTSTSLVSRSRCLSESSLIPGGLHNDLSKTHFGCCIMGTQMLTCGRTSQRLDGHHEFSRDTVFITNSPLPPPLSCSLSVHPRLTTDETVHVLENHNAEQSPLAVSEYRNYDILEERSHQRRMARVRLDRSRRLRRPYLIPNRMCHSMMENFSGSLSDVYLGPFQQILPASKSTNTSPTKQGSEMNLVSPPPNGTLIRSRSIDNLELAKLRLNDILDNKVELGDHQAMELVASGLRNLQMV